MFSQYSQTCLYFPHRYIPKIYLNSGFTIQNILIDHHHHPEYYPHPMCADESEWKGSGEKKRGGQSKQTE